MKIERGGSILHFLQIYLREAKIHSTNYEHREPSSRQQGSVNQSEPVTSTSTQGILFQCAWIEGVPIDFKSICKWTNPRSGHTNNQNFRNVPQQYFVSYFWYSTAEFWRIAKKKKKQFWLKKKKKNGKKTIKIKYH